MISKINRKKPYQVVISVTDSDGKRKRISKSYSTYAEAKEAEGMMVAEKSIGEHGVKITIEALCNAFCDKRKEEIRITTIDNYRRSFDIYRIPFFHGMDMAKCTKQDFLDWEKFVQESGLTLTSCRNKFNNLHGLLSFAYKEYGMDTMKYLDMAGTFKKDPNQIEEEKALHFWDSYQFRIFIDAFRKECEKFSPYESGYMQWWSCYVMLNILFYAGLRKGEANALTPEDFVQRRGTYYLNVTKSCTHKVKGASGWITTPPKNKTSFRSVPIPAVLANIIKEHLYTRLARLGSKPLYLCGGLTHVPDSTLDKLKDEVESISGVPHIRVHDLRHSYVSVLINANTPITTISKLVGHATSEITWKVYSHLYPDTLASAVTAFDKDLCAGNVSDYSHTLCAPCVAFSEKGTKQR